MPSRLGGILGRDIMFLFPYVRPESGFAIGRHKVIHRTQTRAKIALLGCSIDHQIPTNEFKSGPHK